MGKSQLTEEQMKEIVALVIETHRKEQEAQRKKAFDRRLHNTRLLLINYRGLLANSERSVYEALQCDEDVYDILSLMTGKASENEVYVESIKRSAAKTALIIEHIKRAVADYGEFCKRSGKREEVRRWRTVMRLYIDDEAWTPEEVALAENLDVSVIYKDVKAAVKRLAPRIFGIDGIFFG